MYSSIWLDGSTCIIINICNFATLLLLFLLFILPFYFVQLSEIVIVALPSILTLNDSTEFLSIESEKVVIENWEDFTSLSICIWYETHLFIIPSEKYYYGIWRNQIFNVCKYVHLFIPMYVSICICACTLCMCMCGTIYFRCSVFYYLNFVLFAISEVKPLSIIRSIRIWN